MSAPRLILLNTERQGQEFFLSKSVTTIGRAPENDIVVDQISVSRNHARIERFGVQFIASDLGSRNGIKISGRAVPEGPLAEGGTLAIGDVLFQCVGMAVPKVEPPPPAPPAPRKDRAPTPPPLPAPPVAQPPQPQAPLAPPAAAAPPGPPGPRPAPAPPKPPRTGPVLSGMAVFVLVVLLCAAVLAGTYHFLSRTIQPQVMEMLPVILKVGENRWLPVQGRVRMGGQWVFGSSDFDEHSVSIDSDAVSVKKFGEGEMVVSGLSHGNATIAMRSPRGNRISLKVYVRGRLETFDEDVQRLDISDAERLRRAQRNIQAGEIQSAKGNPYLALREYEAAVRLLEPLPDKPMAYMTARAKAKEAASTVDNRYRTLIQQARQVRDLGDYVKALDIINLIKDLVPDANDPRYQRADNFLQTWELEKQMAKSKR